MPCASCQRSDALARFASSRQNSRAIPTGIGSAHASDLSPMNLSPAARQPHTFHTSCQYRPPVEYQSAASWTGRGVRFSE